MSASERLRALAEYGRSGKEWERLDVDAGLETLDALPLIADCIEEAESVASEFVAKSLLSVLERLEEHLEGGDVT